MSIGKALGAGLVALVVGFAQADESRTPTDVVDTRYGGVFGLVEDGISAFKGIRYGAPPVGARRFLPPEPPEPWQGLLDATQYGAPAMQMYGREVGATALTRQLSQVFPMGSEMKIDNEDALFLNVWTPAADDGERPVMVWFHGGGYDYGSGAWPVYDGANLARKGDVVVVTVNHRLNVFGYLDLSSVGGERYAKSGNAGMLDLVLALEWVRDNVARFGGDPDNVTIMGESGGGSKVSTLMAMPAADGLFHKAVIQSGPGLTAIPAERAARTTRAVLAELGLGKEDIGRLTELPAERILAAAQAAAAKVGGESGELPLGPVLDGDVLPRHPFTPDAPAQAKDVPVLIGWNKDELTVFNSREPWFGSLTAKQLRQRVQAMAGDGAAPLLAAYRERYPDYSPTYLFNMIAGDSWAFAGSATLAERKAAQRGAPAYLYYLTWETPVAGGVLKSPHTLDIPFMFANVDKATALTSDTRAARELERQMSSAWISFARDGTPDSKHLPEWPAYDADRRATMVFDAEPRVVEDPKGRIRAMLQQTGR